MTKLKIEELEPRIAPAAGPLPLSTPVLQLWLDLGTADATDLASVKVQHLSGATGEPVGPQFYPADGSALANTPLWPVGGNDGELVPPGRV